MYSSDQIRQKLKKKKKNQNRVEEDERKKEEEEEEEAYHGVERRAERRNLARLGGVRREEQRDEGQCERNEFVCVCLCV